jgi:hypothetical protein
MANKVSDARYREAAHRLHHEDGSCEVDDNAKISRGDDPGAYVQAWVWVYNTDTKRKLAPDETTRWQTPRTLDFPKKGWQYEVANGDTVLGFEEWKQHRADATKR